MDDFARKSIEADLQKPGFRIGGVNGEPLKNQPVNGKPVNSNHM